MIFTEKGTRVRVVEDGTREFAFYLDVYSQPWWIHLASVIYGWYSLRIPCRVPGWKRLVEALGGETHNVGNESFGIPVETGLRYRIRSWMLEQDLRAFDLAHHRYEHICYAEDISAEAHEKL